MKKVTLTAKILAAATVGFSVISLAPAANAASLTSLVPTTEAEIKLDGISCIDPAQCIDTTSLGYKVKSLPFDYAGNPALGLSRLFADKRSTPSTVSGITFNNPDAGTNHANQDAIWLRPVAYSALSPDALPTGTPFENNGQLEAGKFEFKFDKTVSKLYFDLFDVEDSDFTGIIKAWDGAGNVIASLPPLLTGGLDGNIQTLELTNVKKFEIQLGKPGPDSKFGKTGDGVLLRMARTPEPGTMISLGALAVAGMFGVRKGKKASRVG